MGVLPNNSESSTTGYRRVYYFEKGRIMYLVFDIGGSAVKYALITKEGEITEKGKKKVDHDAVNTKEDFVEFLGSIYDEKKDAGPEGIAISLPGQIDIRKGIVYGGGAFPFMDKVPLGDLLSKRCDGLFVALENDGKCAALAEVWLGNAKDVKDAAVLVFGTGIGGAIIRNKKVIHGKHLLAGEVSYIIEEMDRSEVDNIITLEKAYEEINDVMDIYDYEGKRFFNWAATHSTVTMSHRFAKLKGIPKESVTGEDIYRFADEGDKDAIEILEDMYFSIAKQCMNIYLIVDPQIILIGGGISGEPRFVEGIKKYVEKMKRISFIFDNIKIDTCKYMNDSNLYGALYNYFQRANIPTDNVKG